MYKTKYLLLTVFIMTAILLGSCNLPRAQDTADADATIVAETAAAVFTRAAETAVVSAPPETATPIVAPATATIVPTNTLFPTNVPTFTATPIPCNRASFVKDITYPDNTNVPAGSTFTKTWRIKNNGSCTWTADYVLLFDSGEQMGAPATSGFTSGSVAPGETVDISANLTAPSTPGTYQGNFKFRSPNNIVFGINADAQGPFWVKIVVPNPTATSTATTVPAKPDLYITDITYDPVSFKKGDTVTIHVSVYNGGDAASGAFTAAWWPAVGYGNPPTQCTWNYTSMVAHGGHVEDCTFVYQGCSTYTTYAIADTADTVDEADETNNELQKVQVVPCN